MKSKVIFLIVMVWFGVCFWEVPVQSTSELLDLDQMSVPKALDYAQPKSWLALPANPNRFAVDVFWVYPTVPSDKNVWIVNPTGNAHRKAAHHTLVSEASVFDHHTNIYAPLYRQMSMEGLSLRAAKRELLLQYGEDDVWRALQFYLEHYNKGKPFILAGHSQGSNILTQIVMHHWGKTGLDKRLGGRLFNRLVHYQAGLEA